MADNELNIISSDTNSVNVITEDNTLTITNDSDTTTVTLSAAETTTVQIAIAGPKGDKGEAGNIDVSTLATTGSNTFNGNQIISGSLNITTGITGSLKGTASWAENAVTASFAPNYVLTSTTSSMLQPYVLTSQTSSMLQPYVLTSQTSSMTVATSSYYSEKDPIFTAKSASLATTGSNTFNGNQIISGSLNITAGITGSEIQITGSLNITGSLKQNGSDVARPYKVYTALLTQSGETNEQSLYGSGTLNIGVTYRIQGNDSNTTDFTNVGAPNNDEGTYFVATGTTPNSWGDNNDGQLVYNTGAPVVTILENNVGNIWFEYSSVGRYVILSSSLFTTNKTFVLIGNAIGGNTGELVNFGIGGDSSIILWSLDNAGSQANGILSNTPIEIRVYN